YVDCTFGAGGYTKAILESNDCKVVAIDQDPSTEKYYQDFAKKYGKRICYINDNFRNLKRVLSGFIPVDGLVYDLGVSSMQLDEGERGFSFQQNAKLDMRMGTKGISAYEIVNEYNETHLADIIYNYGGEGKSRKIAKKIVEARSISPINTTFELAKIVRSVCAKVSKIDPATKTFQAIRIAVNDEIGSLEESLAQIVDVLKIGGRVAIVSFHELEDRVVKQFFIKNSAPKVAVSKYAKHAQISDKPFKIITRKSIKPSYDEIRLNPRSRSARLRVIEKVGA
ncbi:MAG: 16S rRNA (cytosine(1402)-N(4))-methyltransferase RsmH, partial [Rickettsiaceae bacterium]|nr:16S rRNA (cytosine(1402)-N(4))-methyltransferase RsmH [Rickettsiaceae bacterium]